MITIFINLIALYVAISLMYLLFGTIYSFILYSDEDLRDIKGYSIDNDPLSFLKEIDKENESNYYKFSISRAIYKSFNWYKYIIELIKRLINFIEW